MSDQVGNKVGDKTDKVNAKKVNNNIKRILELMRDNPNITKFQLCIALGLKKTSIDNYISNLRKNNIIERVGSNKTGYWKVNQ